MRRNPLSIVRGWGGSRARAAVLASVVALALVMAAVPALSADGVPTLEEAYAIEYAPNANGYYVVGKDTSGSLTTFFGEHKRWVAVDLGIPFAPGEFYDFSVGNSFVAIGNELGEESSSCSSSNGGDTSQVGTLDTCRSIDFDGNDYYVVGVGEENTLELWKGDHNAWTPVDLGIPFSQSEFVDFAFGNSFVAIGNGDGCVSSEGGATSPVGTLQGCLSIDFDADNGNYYVVGVKDGQIDVWYGDHGSWTQLQENRDIDNRYTPAQFVDFSIGGEPGQSMFAVAIGNIENYKIGFRKFAPRGTSINGREFYDKPYFGDGRPLEITDTGVALSPGEIEQLGGGGQPTYTVLTECVDPETNEPCPPKLVQFLSSNTLGDQFVSLEPIGTSELGYAFLEEIEFLPEVPTGTGQIPFTLTYDDIPPFGDVEIEAEFCLLDPRVYVGGEPTFDIDDQYVTEGGSGLVLPAGQTTCIIDAGFRTAGTTQAGTFIQPTYILYNWGDGKRTLR